MKNKAAQIPSKGEVVIYRAKDKKIRLEVKLEQETVWLSQKQIADLFIKDIRTINEHIQNIFKEGELKKNSVIRNFRITAADGKSYITNFYNLDVIISVGYRIKSRNGTRFRIWATNVIKKHLIDGYTINEQRLRQQTQKLLGLQRAVKLIGSTKDRKQLEYKEAIGLLEVISDYNYALGLLDDYDYKRLKISQTSKDERFILSYKSAIEAVNELKKKIGSSDLFGVERDESFKSSISSVYQTFSGKDLYPSIEEKAANLLYFIVKNHSFVDGNKRIAASIFLWFLEKNGILYKEDGSKLIADNALVALTLMIAESKPSERDVIVTLTVNLINKNN
ncbi:MAG: virulence protein RhuM/Fic/DOC family protein [Candidatus Omnitrophota bacterium]|nr:type II toxin-antitoxin system death-on-curing family toxin [Candidatus Omnitrophota bacterium]MBU1929666.1 type II toxin-antitoxin system death-on-curing family toxin [Candidatus Omnitrophota bacterium]MBU2035078.1 type II toxin-antitoxin system death-on-curing family toxin [Candidatus Omnitrophota bacterium]MBU2257976.1 type II toxin-antitoxin system death-on-curing family toxin [Candidatus Omnitrophota bacterium]